MGKQKQRKFKRKREYAKAFLNVGKNEKCCGMNGGPDVHDLVQGESIQPMKDTMGDYTGVKLEEALEFT